MAGWILVPCLVRLRSDFNALAPNRDRSSDGSIGDAAHQSSLSDHNPDETGNVPIRDADKINEVHAIDVDVDLRLFGVSMEDVVQFLLDRCRSGAEKRLRYIIFNRRIWSANKGWREQRYTGANPHDHHAHFSASYETKHENDASSWELETLMALSDDDRKWFAGQMAGTVKTELDAFAKRDPLATILARSGEQRTRMGVIMEQAAAGQAVSLADGDVTELADRLAAALSAKQAGALADELARRLRE